MNADELNAAWCVPADETWYRAVLQKIDDALEDALEISTTFQTASNHGLLAHSVGGLEALRTLRQELERTRVEAFEIKRSAV